MSEIKPLTPESLYGACDPAQLDFDTTDAITDLAESFGQSRAVDAIHFGTGIQRPGYNLFVLGDHGTGRHSIVQRLLGDKAKNAQTPSDWCYVNNFVDPRKPSALKLPAGKGMQLRNDMQQFVAELAPAMAAAFESDQYRQRIEAIQEEFKKREEDALGKLGQEALKHGIGLIRTPHGFAFAPVKGDEPITPDEFAKLPEEEKERLGDLIESFGKQLHDLIQQAPRWRRDVQQRVKEASRDTLGLAAGHLVEELKERYRDLPDVIVFLDAVLHDVVETGQAMHEQQHSEGDLEALLVSGAISVQRYLVNLIVDNSGRQGAPVVYEDNPTHPNIVGRVDQIAHMGTLVTNVMLIKDGALHRANGGYLVLDVRKVLQQPYAWEGLKRALRSGRIHIESLGQLFGFVGTLTLEPDPIPLNLKVVLIGERRLYYLLSELDPDFSELFKVAADFESDVERDPGTTAVYARLIAALVRGNSLKPFDRGAVARVIEYGARLSGQAERLSTHTRKVSDLLREADHWAVQAGRAVVTCQDVEDALERQVRRSDRLQRRGQDAILEGTLLIDTTGAQAGQVNGLAVISLGDYTFGHPVRITATVRLGEGDVIDIERESELGGAIHSKGVMILSAFLAARYARLIPLSLNASLVFEQSYATVEGDSASLAELCALLSVLARAPVRQSLAMTGSVNQHGQVQAIGAVNEKIEGFFDLCKARGLTGDQGVLIPAANVRHLMLRKDVVEAAANKKFHIYAVRDVDEAMELLTGLPAGLPDEQGNVPEGSINYLVAAEVADMTARRQAFGISEKKG